MTADGWVWASLGLLLALLGARAWVVETGHATLGRTPVKVKVLTGACGLAVALVVGLVAVNGGARLVYLVLHPEVAQALEDARNQEDATTAPATPAPATPAPATAPVAPPGTPAPAAPPSTAPPSAATPSAATTSAAPQSAAPRPAAPASAAPARAVGP